MSSLQKNRNRQICPPKIQRQTEVEHVTTAVFHNNDIQMSTQESMQMYTRF